MDINPIHVLKKIVEIPSRIRKLEYKVSSLEERVKILERDANNSRNASLPEAQYAEALSALYFIRTGKHLNLSAPKSYNEKIQWFKLYGYTSETTMLADKYWVRTYVKERIGEQYLIPLLGVWKNPSEIDFSVLPKQFVLKANHGSGYNYIVRDKSQMDEYDIVKSAWKWLREDYAFKAFEMQYHDISRCLIAEEYIENDDGQLNDYKLMCFNGRVEYIQFMSGRGTGIKQDIFDRGWNLQPFTHSIPNSGKQVPRPDNLDEMIGVGEKLAAGFPHVRVDFYRLNTGKLFFGEMTFTPTSGFGKWQPPETDLILGQLFNYQ